MMNRIDIEFDAEVGQLTTFAIPARAAALVRWSSAEDLRAVMGNERLPRPLKVIGGGSNLLFTGPFAGSVLVRSGEPTVERDGLLWTVDAHMVLDDLCALVASAGLRGMENLSGIPGTLGGALVQNAGAYGAETGALLHRAELFDLQSGEMLSVGREWMQYAYRSSRLKAEEGRYVILRASLRLLPADSEANLGYGNLGAMLDGEDPTPQRVREAVLKMRAGKLPDPAETGSAGSFFRNPEVTADLLRDEMPRYDLGNGLFKVPAAWLIDHAGLKGASEGGASVWPSQPLVIVNTRGEATSADVLALEQKIVRTVSERFSINLIPEVEHL